MRCLSNVSMREWIMNIWLTAKCNEMAPQAMKSTYIQFLTFKCKCFTCGNQQFHYGRVAFLCRHSREPSYHFGILLEHQHLHEHAEKVNHFCDLTDYHIVLNWNCYMSLDVAQCLHEDRVSGPKTMSKKHLRVDEWNGKWPLVMDNDE